MTDLLILHEYSFIIIVSFTDIYNYARSMYMAVTWKQCGFAVAAIFLFAAAQVHASPDNPLLGEKLYKESCMSCHTERPVGMLGAPTALLVEKMHAVKKMDAPQGKVAQMQKVLKTLSDQEITDIAVYLNGMK